MKVYHRESKIEGGNELQFIFVASNESKGIDNLKEIYTQIIVSKNQKSIDILIPKDWNARTKYL